MCVYKNISLFLPLQTGLYKGCKQRVRTVWPTFKFRMVLYPHKKWMVCVFHRFHQPAIGRKAAEGKPGLVQGFAVVVIHLVAVAVAFCHLVLAVDLLQAACLDKAAGIST